MHTHTHVILVYDITLFNKYIACYIAYIYIYIYI